MLHWNGMARTTSKKKAAQSTEEYLKAGAQSLSRPEEENTGPSSDNEEPSTSRPVRIYADGEFKLNAPVAFLVFDIQDEH